MKQYQPYYINGEAQESTGLRDCVNRYELMRPIFAQYNRPFTVLDIGANAGYFSLRIAHEFPNAICVMVEASDTYANQCLNLIEQSSAKDRLFLLKCKLTANDIVFLKNSEYFDVALVLSVLHHTRNKWQEFSEALQNVANYLVIENPPEDDTGAKGYGIYLKELNDWWGKRNPIQLGKAQRGTSSASSIMQLFLQNGSKVLNERRTRIGETNIISSSEFCYRIKNRKSMFPWVHGLSAKIYTLLNGVHPPRKDMRARIKKLIKDNFEAGHEDPSLCNIILKGDTPILIDDGPRSPKHGLRKYLIQVDAAFNGRFWKF